MSAPGRILRSMRLLEGFKFAMYIGGACVQF